MNQENWSKNFKPHFQMFKDLNEYLKFTITNIPPSALQTNYQMLQYISHTPNVLLPLWF